jgi:hypothetical protein
MTSIGAGATVSVVAVVVVPLPGAIVSATVVGGPAIVVVVDVAVGTVVDVVPLGGATVVVVVVAVVVVGSLLVGGAGVLVGVVVVESSGLASAIEPGSAINANTAGATARNRFERDTIALDLTPDQRHTRVYGASSSARSG